MNLRSRNVLHLIKKGSRIMHALINIIDTSVYIHALIDICRYFSYDNQSFTSLSLKRDHRHIISTNHDHVLITK